MPKPGKPIRYKPTGKMYSSEVAAGKDLGPTLVPEAKQDNFVWFRMHRAHPHDFQTMIDGEWVDYPPSTTAEDLRAKRDPVAGGRAAGNGAAPAGPGDLHRFSLTRRVQEGTVFEVEHYLV